MFQGLREGYASVCMMHGSVVYTHVHMCVFQYFCVHCCDMKTCVRGYMYICISQHESPEHMYRIF